MEKQKVTIVIIGMLGYNVIEATLLEHGRREYAQHRDAAFMRWIPKGSRSRTCSVIEGSAPFFVALQGWGLSVPACEQWVSTGPNTRQGKYPGVDERWRLEMNHAVATAIAGGAVVVCDYRSPINEEYLARCIARSS
jgi:hypothetical protein